MIKHVYLFCLALTLVLLSGVYSSASSSIDEPVTEWTKCDGYSAPIGKAREEDQTSITAHAFGVKNSSIEENLTWGTRYGDDGIKECDQVLAGTTIENFPTRKINILRARAIHMLEAAKYRDALAEIQGLSTYAENLSLSTRTKQDVYLALKVVEAGAYFDLGQSGKGAEIVDDLVTKSPYSRTRIGKLLVLLPKNWTSNDSNPALIKALTKFSSQPIYNDAHKSISEFPGNRENINKWKYLVRSNFQTGQSKDQSTGMADPLVYAFGATELARYGDIDLARKWLQKADSSDDQQKLFNQRLKTVIDIYAHYHAGNLEEVKKIYSSKPALLANSPTYAQIKILREAIPPEERTGVLTVQSEYLSKLIDTAREQGPKLHSVAKTRDLFDMFPLWQQYRIGGTKFSQSYSLFGNLGFNSKKLSATSWEVDFTGKSSSRVAVEEMALLRAAQIAEKRKSRGFIVHKQIDYSRKLYGRGHLGSAAGFKTKMTISLLDPTQNIDAVLNSRMFETSAVIRDLAPIYETAKQRKKRLRKEQRERRKAERKRKNS